MDRLPFAWARKATTVEMDSGRFRADSGSQVMTILFEEQYVHDAIKAVLGYCWSASEPHYGTVLKRYLPAAHPRFPWLRATEILSIKGIKPNQQDLVGLGFSGKYKLLEMQIFFEARTFSMREDDPGLPEYHRFTRREFEVSLEQLTRRNETFTFINSTNWPVVQSRPQFPGGPVLRVPKLLITYHWLQVPHTYLFGQGGNRPTNLMSCVGKVNHQAFPNSIPVAGATQYGPGTLLCLQPKLKPTAAIPQVLANGPADPFLMYDVQIPMLEFNPPSAETITYNGKPIRGHNLFPLTAPVGGGIWWLATRNGEPAVDGNFLYEYGNFEGIWQGV